MNRAVIVLNHFSMLCIMHYYSFSAGSCGDIAYLSLEVFTKLVTSGKVADICWDFILCSTVTMMQVRMCSEIDS